MSVELKIKSKHLSVEAKLIRFEEIKLKKQVDWLKERQQPADEQLATMNSLIGHRRWDVRNENRATFLARAYIAGRAYNTIEAKRNDNALLKFVIFPRVCSMINKYGPASDRLYKKWNRDRKQYEYDPEAWKAFEAKVSAWLGL